VMEKINTAAALEQQIAERMAGATQTGAIEPTGVPAQPGPPYSPPGFNPMAPGANVQI